MRLNSGGVTGQQATNQRPLFLALLQSFFPRVILCCLELPSQAPRPTVCCFVISPLSPVAPCGVPVGSVRDQAGLPVAPTLRVFFYLSTHPPPTHSLSFLSFLLSPNRPSFQLLSPSLAGPIIAPSHNSSILHPVHSPFTHWHRHRLSSPAWPSRGSLSWAIAKQPDPTPQPHPKLAAESSRRGLCLPQLDSTAHPKIHVPGKQSPPINDNDHLHCQNSRASREPRATSPSRSHGRRCKFFRVSPPRPEQKPAHPSQLCNPPSAANLPRLTAGNHTSGLALQPRITHWPDRNFPPNSSTTTNHRTLPVFASLSHSPLIAIHPTVESPLHQHASLLAHRHPRRRRSSIATCARPDG